MGGSATHSRRGRRDNGGKLLRSAGWPALRRSRRRPRCGRGAGSVRGQADAGARIGRRAGDRITGRAHGQHVLARVERVAQVVGAAFVGNEGGTGDSGHHDQRESNLFKYDKTVRHHPSILL
ncbi:hypothetical protein BGL_1c18720 [Burkholderia plantarii]|uniref:Uncharacterized protein n=1 Tax=Burkholderia plantarii TaxID=41899 RepID=A0A0B6S2F0_BURPL|nr:hypothetical protein BGL_1c18720 [Burkholderia plantarii]